MHKDEGYLNVLRQRPARARRAAIVTLAEDILALKRRGCECEALAAEHGAIEAVLESLTDAVLSGASRADVIAILDTSIDFCATHFADEEAFMGKRGDADLDAHAAAHKQLLAKFVNTRRRATGDGLSVAALDAVGLLHTFHEHVGTWDRCGVETEA
jgi:hemerythrin